LKDEIEKALSSLVGLDLVSIGRAADLEWFTFGRHKNAESTAEELAPFALHVSCPWRLLGRGQVLAGSTDHRRPAGKDTSEEDFDSRLIGSEWIDVRQQQLREQLEQTRHSVSRIEVDESGWLRLALSFDLVLEVFPDASAAEHDEVEFWRLFQPGLDYSHFVMSSNGVDRVSDA
jgi:hypothetical protein